MSCTQNGYLDQAECLAPIAGGYYAAKGPAAAWNACAAEIKAKEGVTICVNGPDSAYRTFARQQYYRNYWCGLGKCENAAIPGNSNHGWGWAFDVPDWVGALLDKYGAKYGFRRACSDAPWENWHWHWCGGWSGKDPGPDGSPPDPYPVLKKGDHGDAVERMQKHLRRWNLGLTRPDRDGDFGATTEKALREFQITHGMHDDGVCGKKTWKALRKKDRFHDDERRHINTIRLIRHHGVGPDQRPHLKRARDWCGRRGDSLRNVAHDHGWGDDNRLERFKTMQRLAGHKPKKEHA